MYVPSIITHRNIHNISQNIFLCRFEMADYVLHTLKLRALFGKRRLFWRKFHNCVITCPSLLGAIGILVPVRNIRYCNVDGQSVAKQRLCKQTSTIERLFSMRSAPSKTRIYRKSVDRQRCGNPRYNTLIPLILVFTFPLCSLHPSRK
jgi:hypothetical protein